MKQPYGSRWRDLNREAYAIWRRRDQEPAESPEFGMRALFVVDDEDDKSAAYAAQVWRVCLNKLSVRETHAVLFRFVHDLTLEEAGERMMVSTERVRQLETLALRKMRRVCRS